MPETLTDILAAALLETVFVDDAAGVDEFMRAIPARDREAWERALDPEYVLVRMRCVFPDCVSTDKHWHGGFPGGFNHPQDPAGEKPPVEFIPEMDPGWVYDLNGGKLVQLDPTR